MDDFLREEVETYFQENQYSLESANSLATKIGRREEDLVPIIEELIRDKKLHELDRSEEILFVSQNFEEISSIISNHSKVRLTSKVKLEEGMLTSREEEVFYLMIEGSNNQELAHHLHISENTVKNHVTSIFKKLGVQDRLQLIKRYANYR